MTSHTHAWPPWLPCCAALLLGFQAHAAWQRHVIDGASRGADGVRLADVNGDALPDITTGWEEGGVIRIYINPGHTRAKDRWPAVTVGRGKSVEDAVLVDLDGDGRMDVVSSCEGKTRAMFVHWAPKDPERHLDAQSWRTEPLPASANAMMWMFCEPLQVDGRHGVDLIAGGKGPNAALGWFEAPGDARRLDEWTWHSLRPAGWIMSLLATDMDGDGDKDILFTDRKGNRTGCYWLENPGARVAATAAWREHLVGGDGQEVMFLAPSDLDRDGLTDVLVANRERGLLFLRRVDGTGTRWETHTIAMPASVGPAKAVSSGDIDLDGRPDLVVTCEHADGHKRGTYWLSYHKSPTDASWIFHDISGEPGTKYDLVELIDLDGDGDLDVLTCEERENLGVFWYENPSRASVK